MIDSLLLFMAGTGLFGFGVFAIGYFENFLAIMLSLAFIAMGILLSVSAVVGEFPDSENDVQVSTRIIGKIEQEN